jgi:aminoglycoside phosphotransferase
MSDTGPSGSALCNPAGAAHPVELAWIDQARVRSEIRGRLGTRIQARELPGGGIAYVKIAARGGPENLALESDRLGWLTLRLEVPEILAFVSRDQVDLLALSELPGTPAHEVPDAMRGDALRVVADALHRVHGVNISDCPFRTTTWDEIAAAEAVVARGEVDEASFAAANGSSPAVCLARVIELATALPPRDAVWTHGDFCLPNVLVHSGGLGGILDWGLARVADPARDLAMLEGSLRHNWGASAVTDFYAIWGHRPPRQHIEMYVLLDELFTHVRDARAGEGSS